MPVKNFLQNYYKSILVFTLILIASTIPSRDVPKAPWFPNFDKVVHFGMYFCFSMILIYDLIKSRPDLKRLKIYLIATSIAVIYGASLEIVQATLTNSRSGDPFDLLFNVMGVSGALAFWVILRDAK